MACRALELTLVSARDLKDVNLFSRMQVYAVVSVSSNPLTAQCTATDRCGGRSPTWNATLRLAVPSTAAAASASGAYIHVLLRTERAFGDDRDVGEVFVPVADLLVTGVDCTRAAPQAASTTKTSYQVRKVQCTEPRGVLDLSYRLGPVVAPPPVAQYYAYTPPYVYLPAATSSATAMYGAAPARSMKSRRSGEFGIGLGAGLVGGAIGGMLAGEMLSSDTEAYGAGYKAGVRG